MADSTVHASNYNQKINIPILISIQSGRKSLIEPHYHTHFEFIKLNKGILKFGLNQREFLLKEGDIVICPPLSIHSGTSESDEVETLGILTQKFFYSDYQALPVTPLNLSSRQFNQKDLVISASHPNNKKIGMLMDEISFEYKQKQPLHNLAITSILNLLSAEISRHFNLINDSVKSNNEKSILTAIEYIKENCTEKITLQDLGKVAGMSVSHFSREFKKFTNSSPMDYVIKARVTYAMNLIHSTNLSMAEISEKSGFCNVNYFNKKIREVTGYTPYTYKKLS